jgi:hypothetical protein
MLRTTSMKLAEVHQADFGTARLPEAEAEDSVQKEGQDFPVSGTGKTANRKTGS